MIYMVFLFKKPGKDQRLIQQPARTQHIPRCLSGLGLLKQRHGGRGKRLSHVARYAAGTGAVTSIVRPDREFR